MTQINKYNYTQSSISHIMVDTSNDRLWVGFSLKDGVCQLKNVASGNPLQTYFSIDVAVTGIVKIIESGNYIYVALNDTSLICTRYLKTNPISSTVDFSIPAGINEVPVDIIDDGTYICFLTPGDISGENAKIVRFETDGTHFDTIELTTVTNAKAIAVDDDTGEYWVITYTNPSQFIRVYQLSGGTWTYTINT